MPETLTACPICQSAAIAKRYKGRFQTQVCACTDCGQVFANPRPSDEELAAYYSGEYWTRMSQDDTGLSINNLVRHRERARTQVIRLGKWLVLGHFFAGAEEPLETEAS